MARSSNKIDPLTGKPALTPDELRLALNRLSMKIVRTSDQAVCDILESEYQALVKQTQAKPPPAVSRKSSRRPTDAADDIGAPAPPKTADVAPRRKR